MHRLGDPFFNWYMVEEGGRLTAVDAGLPAFKGSLRADLESVDAGPEDVEAVILTHSDPDHTGVAGALRDAGARVLIHVDDELKLRKPGPKSGDASPIKLLPELRRPTLLMSMARMLRGGAARPTRIEGAETFVDADVLDVPGQPRVIATPGHTPGHSAFHFEGHGVLFVGDELCTWNIVTGRRGPQLMARCMNESTAQCVDSLAAVEQVDADVLLPGHGEPWRAGVAAAVEEARAAMRG